MLASGMRTWVRLARALLGLLSAITACAAPTRAPKVVTHRPVPVTDAQPRVIGLSAGGEQTCALFDTGRARCWGQGLFGGLGRKDLVDVGDDETPATTTDFDAGGRISAISVGAVSTCVLLTTNGQVRCTRITRRQSSMSTRRACDSNLGRTRSCMRVV